jgi:acyl-CoA thioesterase-1
MRSGWRIRLLALAIGVLTFASTAQGEQIRIVAFGTSATYGRYLSRDQTYPAKLERALRAKGYDVVVSNAGKNGDFAAAALSRLDVAVPRGTHIAIVEFGVNEVKLKGLDAATIRRDVGALVARLRARGVHVLLFDYMQLDLPGVAAANGAASFRYPNYIHRDPKYVIPNDPLRHLNATGYDVVVAQMLPSVEAAIAKVRR